MPTWGCKQFRFLTRSIKSNQSVDCKTLTCLATNLPSCSDLSILVYGSLALASGRSPPTRGGVGALLFDRTVGEDLPGTLFSSPNENSSHP